MKNVAIIGSGIAGLSAAYLLNKKYRITLYEKNDYIGGHTATKDVEERNATRAIDTGFIVFNDRTYPLFTRLLAEIGVSCQPTEMSFSVSGSDGLEYNGHSLNSLFAQRRNLLRPRFWRLLYDIVRFNRLCKRLYHRDTFTPGMTLAKLFEQYKFNERFQQWYLLPMGAAIWSTSMEEMAEFDVRFFVRFFFNHGLLNIKDRPTWFVIPGGSREYIAPLIASFSDRIHTNSRIASVIRAPSGVELRFEDGESAQFDAVVFACHSDQALALLGDASEQEKEILGGIPYTPNEVILHTDDSFLPSRKAARASWNYNAGQAHSSPASVTYYMNILQGFECDIPYCVTLNPARPINDSKILKRFIYYHPVLDACSVKFQQRRGEINGNKHTYFCGAYWYNGFHEDGVRSAVDVANLMGVDYD